MVHVSSKDDVYVLKLDRAELRMLRQSFSEICYGTRAKESQQLLNITSQEALKEFSELKQIYDRSELIEEQQMTQITVDREKITLYVRAIKIGLDEFEGELHTMTGVTEEEAGRLLSGLEAIIV